MADRSNGNNDVCQAQSAEREAHTREGFVRLTADVLGILNQPQETVDSIREIVLRIRDFLGFDAVGVRLREKSDYPYYETRGFPEDFVQGEKSLCVYDEAGEILRDKSGMAVLACMCGDVIRGRTDPAFPFFTEGGSFFTNSTTDFISGDRPWLPGGPLRNRCCTSGYESLALIPLRSGDEIIGLLQINDKHRDQLDEGLIRRFEELGQSIGVAFRRKAAEEAVLAEKERTRRYFDAAEVIMAVLAPDRTIRDVNRKGCEVLGYAREELIGEDWLHLAIAEPSREDLGRLFERIVLRQADPENSRRIRTLTRSGEERMIDWRASLLADADGEISDVIASGIDVTDYCRLERKIESAEEEERRRIGEDLHDSVCQHLVGLRMLAESLAKDLAKQLGNGGEKAEELSDGLRTLIEETRDLSHGLLPVRLESGGIDQALYELAATTEKRTDIRCEVSRCAPCVFKTPESATHLYRIAQEAVANALRHSRCHRIRIELQRRADRAVLTVSDDGIGIPTTPKASKGFGLKTIQRRVDLMDGLLHIASPPEGGTTLRIEAPILRRPDGGTE